VPAGCARDDGRDEEVVEIARLGVGQSAEASFEARIVAVVGEVRCEGGVVHFGDGRRVALVARGGVVPEPLVVAPNVVVTPGRRRADVVIDVRNDGWAEARDVRVRVELPDGVRWIADTFSIDGAPVGARSAGARSGGVTALARVESAGDARVVVISAVPARRCVRVSFAAAYGPVCAGGAIVVRAGEHVVEEPLVPIRVRDVRVQLADVVRAVLPGEVFTVAARVENFGDVAERLTFAIAGLPFSDQACPSRSVSAGCAVEVKVDVAVPDDPTDGASFAAAFVATAEDGESARATFELRVRHGVVDVFEGPIAEAMDHGAPRLRAELQVPEAAMAGVPFAARIVVDTDVPIDTMTVRVPAPEATAYLHGSATLDGLVLLDGTPKRAVSPFEGDGLVLRDVAPRRRLVFGWSVRCDVNRTEPIVVVAQLEADGEAVGVSSPCVAIRARDNFAARPPGVPYHVESCAIAPAAEIAAAEIAAPVTLNVSAAEIEETPVSHRGGVVGASFDEAPVDETSSEGSFDEVAAAEAGAADFEPSMRLSSARLDDVSRLFASFRFEGLVQHLFALRFFFADAVGVSGVAQAELDAVNGAMRDVFDRLFVKLRIPGFGVSSDDLEDHELRQALVALFGELALCVPDVANVCRMLAEARYGAPPVLRALVGLLPVRCDDDRAVGGALAHYASVLDGVLARYEGLPLELFDDALAHRGDAALDDARVALLDALRPHITAVAVAC
jgi:hypothetical protein